jgi:O-methyltransferase
MTLGTFARSLLKTPIGKKITHWYLSLTSWMEEEQRNELDPQFYEKLHREEFFAKTASFLAFNHVKGDYLEFGCHGGVTFGLAHKYKHIAKLSFKLYGFDSFKGLPKPQGIDVHSQWKEGGFAMSMSKFKNMLKEMGIDETEYVLVPGFYDESLKSNPPSKIGFKNAAFVYIDCDLYESTVPVLNYILPVLQTGSVVAFDDFYCFNGDPDRGGQLALKEFLLRNPDIMMVDYSNIGWHGKAFIVKKR